MTLTILASSSKANCAIVSTESTRIMVDAGLPWKECFARMAEAGISGESITAMAISHEHGDHCYAAFTIARRLAIPIFCSFGTWESLWTSEETRRNVKCNTVNTEEIVQVGDIAMTAFPIPHDAAEPLGFTFRPYPGSGHRIGIATDLGEITKEVADDLRSCNLILLEANHDRDAMLAGGDPHALKRRQISGNGHLSNSDVAEFLETLTDSTSTVILGHLSERNNDPDLVEMMARKALRGKRTKVLLAEKCIGEVITA